MRNILLTPEARDIIRSAASVAGVEEQDLLGRCRSQHLARARFAAMARLRALGMSYPRIGRAFGRDHSTIMHGVREARRLRCIDPEFADFLTSMDGAPQPVVECDRPKAAPNHFPYRHRTMADVMAAEALALVGIEVRAL